MSTVAEPVHPNPEIRTMSYAPGSFEYVLTHVFFPLDLPKYQDYALQVKNDLALAGAVCAAAHNYSLHVRGTLEEGGWSHITKMLDNLRASTQSERLDKNLVVSQLRHMETGGILTFFVRRQNAAIILTKRESSTLFESFEVSPSENAVKESPGRLICSYPWSTVETPNEVFDDEDFQIELANFLSFPSTPVSDPHPSPRTDPKYITALLTAILRGVGRSVSVVGIMKHIRDNIGQWRHGPDEREENQGNWRRSAVWLLIRVAIQTSTNRPSIGHASYKQFILYFMCTLARDENNTNLSRDLLHLVSYKILCRLRKLGTSAPNWLSEMALGTCARLQVMLDVRRKDLSMRPSLFRNPTQIELIRDTKLPLKNNGKYFHEVLSAPGPPRLRAPFHPNHHPRGTLEDFLSSNGTFFDQAYEVAPGITLYDVEQSIGRELDDWVAHVTSANDDCIKLGILMNQYIKKYTERNPEDDSIKILTILEFFIALDKLAVGEIPMLADYFPDVQIGWLEKLCLHNTTNLHRLSCAYQYLSARQSQSHPGWLVPSDDFTEYSFPVRYYNQSPHLHELKTRIEREEAKRPPAQWRATLPESPLQAKVVVFELQCPPCFRVWRSAIVQLRSFIKDEWSYLGDMRCTLLKNVLELQPYLVDRGPLLYPQIHLAYIGPEGILRRDDTLRSWKLRHIVHKSPGSVHRRWQSSGPTDPHISEYSVDPLVNSTSHTSNDVLAKQADCPADLSLDEFITFGHLRSGPSLQWLNILQALCTRTLNLRSNDVLLLLTNATSQVGPLDPNTGTWIWHQELQDASFCNTLLNELDAAFVDGEGLVDAVFMSTISLLLARILAWSPSVDVSERAITSLERVRRKTFGWVQDLSYDLKMEPANKERRKFLRYMCAACRSTFDVDRITLPMLIRSTEDVDALLSCFFFTQAPTVGNNPDNDDFMHLKLLFDRNSGLALDLEEITRNVILADPSDYGFDLAVARFFTTYHPGALRSEALQYPSAHWLTCKTNDIGGQPSRTLHINLLDGQLRVDGQPFGCLPQWIRNLPEFKRVFGSGNCFVTPSDLPGMDFMTLTLTPKYKVHFLLQGNDLLVRAQCNRTNQLFELIPSDVLRKHLPPVLIDNHVHWLDLITKIIEIHPLRQCWEQSAEHWRIEYVSGSYQAYKGPLSLVNNQSPTWKMLSQCFKCLSDKSILVTTSPDSAQQLVLRLSIMLLDYGLSFFVNGMEELESCDFKYMVYDEDQCIQTLFGLESFLVLRPVTRISGVSIPEAMLPRLVLIPDGHPYSRDYGSRFSFDSSSYHTFKVDPDLGCLIGNGSAKSTRLLAHLHAEKSFHGPDLLTCKMGTQAALDLLQSAGCRSIMQIKALDNLGLWSSSKYPQIRAMYNEIQERYYWERHLTRDDLPGKRAARRSVHLFPFNAIGPTSTEICNDLKYAVPSSNRELEDDIVSATVSSACYRSTSIPPLDCDTISKWVERCQYCMRSTSHGYRGYGVDPDFTRAVAMVHQILKTTKETARKRFHLLFLLPMIAYYVSFYQAGPLPKLVTISGLGQSHPIRNLPLASYADHPSLVSPAQYTSNQHTSPQITLDRLLSKRNAPELPQRSTLSKGNPNGTPQISSIRMLEMSKDIDIPALDHLFSSIQTHSAFQRKYVTLLQTSAGARKEFRTTRTVAAKYYIGALRQHYMKCRTNYVDALDGLKKRLGPGADDASEQALEQLGHWPAVTADVLLRCLASTSPIHISEDWKKCLVSFALLLLELQRARRLLRFALDSLEEEFWKELENEQCDGWNPERYPDWLLIQVQGNFLIRRAQAETAMELISPQSGGNTVVQVNMGEGKSSVIIPIVAAVLADGKQLVRVIVPKSLIPQMFDILVASLGGLANRPIYNLPFSRTGHINESAGHCGLEHLPGLMSRCMDERGVLLLQPEHVVSLKLMSVEKQIRQVNTAVNSSPGLQKSIYSHVVTRLPLCGRLLSDGSLGGRIFRCLRQSADNTATGDSAEVGSRGVGAPNNPCEWLSLDRWLHSNVRDILDESDEVLHSRFQLIYTVGLEQHVDGYPDRWMITQHILRLVKEHLHTLAGNYPNSVEYERGPPGSFPRVRIVQTTDISRYLISMAVEDVMAGRFPNLNFQQLSDVALRDAIRSFISDKNVLQVSATARRVEEYATRSNQSYLWKCLLLLRGLLSSDILLFALTERRWRVDYGLDRHSKSSTKLAVPYRAKDVPAPNVQFGHPDLTIILTCLAYYYAGLTEEQLRTSFEILLDLDDPSAEYSCWTEDCEPIPESLRKLRDINPRSSEQWDKLIFPLFSRNQVVVNFYLSRVVFPKEAKEFPWKLCGSSWDLGEQRDKVVTGFSGTCDSRWLLPLSVIQHDLDHQQGASGNVLTRLLHQEQTKESENYIVTHGNGEQQTTQEFLKLVAMQRPEIRVLLDVGAQILDLSNYQVAEAWLGLASDVAGAIYFDENDELAVLPRYGRPRPLSSSPLSQQLGNCVVYLDHVHTRGTDLKLPTGSRAAVTLGSKMTKDALVQGCMRMRKLGHGHTVMFFAPPGVDQSIRSVAGKHDLGVQVTIADILSWTIHETWTEIQYRAPYWAQQGIDHQSRSKAWSHFCSGDSGSSPKQLSDVWRQPNSKSLVDLYAPQETGDLQSDLSAVSGMEQRCKDLGVLSIPRGGLEEEQEREVHREREREREVEPPPEAKPADHSLHPDVVAFVKTGIIPPLHSDGAFLPVFTTLERSTATTRDANVWSPSILATVDFSRTIKPESTEGTMDQYLRPVQWILSSRTDNGPLLVILSPFEADFLMPDIRASKHVHLHLYAPRTAKRMKPSDDLRLYVIPPLPSDWTPPWELIDQLNVFAGQLYLRDYQSYLRLCRFLDVPSNESASSRVKVRRNLFNIPGSFEEMEITFADSPLPAVMALLAIRTRGRPFDHTHMGKILQGQVLIEKDFEDPKSGITDYHCLLSPPSCMGYGVRPEDSQTLFALHQSSKRRLEAVGTDPEGSRKCPRTEGATPSMLSSPPNDVQNVPESSRASKRTFETAGITGANRGPTSKRPRTN